tara:strand:+ start:954 stop:1460 length:507 start_codon:yes stop_codon:yes gene_type:complete
MARRKVDKTVEHRITFGDLERREFKQSMDAYQRNMNLQAGINGGRVVMYAGVAAGIGLVGYLGVKVYASIFDVEGGLKESVEDFWNKLNGTKFEHDPETGETTTVPNTVQSPTGRTFDENDTGEIANPAAGIPVIGGLFYTGMKIGQLSFLGTKYGGPQPVQTFLNLF